jgi:hypothetical protein
MRALAPPLLALLLLLPAAASATVPAGGVAKACVDPAEVVGCIVGEVQGTFACQRHDADHVSCWANATWIHQSGTTLPAGVRGDVSRAGGLQVDWCDIGGLCRGVGLRLLIVGCTWQAGQPCGGSFQHSLWLGTPRIPPGACIDLTFSPWVRVWGDVHPPAASRAARLVLHGDEGPLLQAAAHPSVVEKVCN